GWIEGLPTAAKAKFRIKKFYIDSRIPDPAAWRIAEEAIVFKSIPDITTDNFYHEVFHSIVHTFSGDYQFFADALDAIGWIELAEKMRRERTVMIEFPSPAMGLVLGEELSNNFSRYMRKEKLHPRWIVFFEDLFPK
ncbi:unnamed protein product, partial [marine sediment metagenome]